MERMILKSLSLMGVLLLASCSTQPTSQWSVHDMSRPAPPVVTPGKTNTAPPSDAVILFDGSGLSEWKSAKDGGDVKWKVQDGYMEVVPKTGAIQTRQSFGSCQLHIEWCSPEIVEGQGQKRGNSGIFLMSKYELQVLDCFENTTYADGQAGAVYGQKPPLVNVCRAPGQWQTYDIVFHAPVFNDEKLETPASVTVFQNGILVQDNWTIKGTTFHKKPAYYEAHPEKMPLMLQDHRDLVRYRNIWIRPLTE